MILVVLEHLGVELSLGVVGLSVELGLLRVPTQIRRKADSLIFKRKKFQFLAQVTQVGHCYLNRIPNPWLLAYGLWEQ